MTYRVWLSQTYGNMGSAILITASSESEARRKAIQLDYLESQIAYIELLGH